MDKNIHVIEALSIGDNTGIIAIPYAKCETEANVALKTVAPVNGFVLEPGAQIRIKFAETNTSTDAISLNVSNTGAKPIYHLGSPVSGSILTANKVFDLLYNSDEQWEIINVDTDTVYIHDTYTEYVNGLYKITVEGEGHVSAATAVTKDDIMNLGIPGQDNDTKVTAVGNHYTPTADSTKTLSVDASSTTSATWGSTNLVTGVNIQRDAAGHVTGVTVDSIQMPANPNTDNNTAHTHEAGTGLELDNAAGYGTGGTTGKVKYKAKLKSETPLTLDSSASTTTSGRVYPVSVDKSGYLAVNVPWTDTNTQDGNNNQTVRTETVVFGADDPVTIKAGNNNITVEGDAVSKTITITAKDESSLTKAADSKTADQPLEHGDSFSVLTDIEVNDHTITDVLTKFTLPPETELSRTNSGEGNGISDISVNNHTISVTRANFATADTNTTYDLAASTSSSNGNVKLNLTAGGSGSGTDSVTVKGSGGTTVTTDNTGVINVNTVLDETTIKLKEDLYTYVPIGNAVYADNETIGSGSIIDTTNRGKLGSIGESLKSVFDKIFGTQQDVQPTITTSNVKLNVNDGTTSYGGGEFGTSVAQKDVTITFTLANSGTAQYGYRCGDKKTTTSDAVFYYPVTKQNDADIKITLPSGKTASSEMVTAGTYKSHSDNILYCNFNSSKQVSIKIRLDADKVGTNSKTRYGQISALVKLGAAQKEDQLTAGTSITAFLTFLNEDADDQSKLIINEKSNTAGAYTISAGSYYNYYLASESATLSSDLKNPVTTAVKFYTSEIPIPTGDTGKHIWFLLPPGTSGDKTIQYEPFANTWVDAFGGESDTTEKQDTVALELDSGAVVNYVGYYTSAKAAANSELNYKIV